MGAPRLHGLKSTWQAGPFWHHPPSTFDPSSQTPASVSHFLEIKTFILSFIRHNPFIIFHPGNPSPLEIAKSNGHNEVVKLLEAAGLKLNHIFGQSPISNFWRQDDKVQREGREKEREGKGDRGQIWRDCRTSVRRFGLCIAGTGWFLAP